MPLLPGVFLAKKKDKTIYYRASITYKNKHISLGSYDTELDANLAYNDAKSVIDSDICTIHTYSDKFVLSFDKYISLVNFRDNDMYCKNPIYLYKNYFIYFLSQNQCIKFDVDDLFYYANHKIMKRGGHFFVSDYGMQVNILTRYGIKNFAVKNRDYTFLNSDENDFRYSNICIINRYHGVQKTVAQSLVLYIARIHVNGDIIIGKYSTENEAAIAYNKAADFLKKHGINKNFPLNYIEEISSIEYSKIYNTVRINKKLLNIIP